MTLDELTKLAHEEIADDAEHRTPRGTAWFDDARASRLAKRSPKLARAISDLFAEGSPCGYDMPRVVPLYVNGRPIGYGVNVPETWQGPADPDDARAMARMLLRAADEADTRATAARTGEGGEGK